MNTGKQGSLLVLTLALAFGLVFQSQAASYPAPTKYKQTMVRVFTESQVSDWLPTYGRHFQQMAVSANGSKIGFTVKLDNYSDKRIYVANADGTGLTDVTGSVPAGKLPQDVASLQMNDTGTRLFFRDYPSGSIYYLDTAPPHNNHVALLGAAWVDARKPYTLDSAGNTLFLKHNVVDSEGFSHNGLYSCPVGGTPAILFNIDQIPHTVDWTLRYLGSGKGGPLFFTFDQDYWTANDFFMYKTGATPTKLPNETHQYIWDEQNLPNSIVSADGSKILYGYADPSTPRQLHLVDTATGAKSFILQTSSLGLDWPTLSADASLARISTGRLRARRIDLQTLAARDTASYWFDEYGTIGASAGLSDLTLDNRSYYLASKKAANNAAIHHIDMAPTDFSQAPNITNIAFNRPFLPFDDTQVITVTAQLSDVKGLGNLQYVHILSLWDGGELPPEGMTYLPLWFGSDFLYDDGTHGDLLAGDGIYTNDTITVQEWSEFYTMNRLPRKVGLRLIAKNQDSHYTIADTEFMVGNPVNPAINALLLLD